MKRILLIAAIFCSVAAVAQQAVLTVNKTTHDFGKINEADGRVTTVFEVKNEGMVPLILSNVRASCGCTTPKWTKEPIAPGQTGQITVTYNPNGRPGRFQKTVTITSNATEATTRLYIKGEVIPKPAKPVDKYPVKMGNLSLQKKSVNMGSVTHSVPKTIEIEYANNTDAQVTVDLLYNTEELHWVPNVTLRTVAPGQTGKIQITLQTQGTPIYGPIESTFYVMVDNKRMQNNEYAITIKADIKEDFSKMTAADIQQAPIAQVNRELSVGTIKQGKKVSSKLSLTNVGVNPMYVRRIYSNDPAVLTAIPPKTAIKGGKKVDLRVDINTAGKDASEYSRELVIITNDPKNPIIKVKVNWVVE